MKHLFFLHLLGAFITITACSSTDDDVASVKDLLTQTSWTKSLDFEDLDLDGNFVEFGDECEKDNIWTFKTDQSLEINEGPMVCDGAPVAITGTWELSDNETVLTIGFGIDPIELKILSISEHTAELGLIESDNPAGVFTQKIILSR